MVLGGGFWRRNCEFVDLCEYGYYTVGKVGFLRLVKNQNPKNRGFVNFSTEFLTFSTPI